MDRRIEGAKVGQERGEQNLSAKWKFKKISYKTQPNI